MATNFIQLREQRIHQKYIVRETNQRKCKFRILYLIITLLFGFKATSLCLVKKITGVILLCGPFIHFKSEHYRHGRRGGNVLMVLQSKTLSDYIPWNRNPTERRQPQIPEQRIQKHEQLTIPNQAQYESSREQIQI